MLPPDSLAVMSREDSESRVIAQAPIPCLLRVYTLCSILLLGPDMRFWQKKSPQTGLPVEDFIVRPLCYWLFAYSDDAVVME